jgi:DNA-binding transcriptional LysR family regulator
VLRGDGVAVLPEYLVQKRIESGALRVVFPKVRPEFDHFRLVFRADDARRPDYEALAAMLLESPLR